MLISFIVSLFMLISTPVQSISIPQEAQTQRCIATTKKGERCKNNAQKGSKYCRVHKAKDPNVQQCKATTKEGKRCSRAATKSGYCTQHYKMYENKEKED